MKVALSLEDMRNSVNTVKQANDELRQAAANMKQAAAALANTWEGSSHDYFVEEQSKMDAWYEQMAQTVDGFVNALNQTIEKYNRTDEQGAKLIKSK